MAKTQVPCQGESKVRRGKAADVVARMDESKLDGNDPLHLREVAGAGKTISVVNAARDGREPIPAWS